METRRRLQDEEDSLEMLEKILPVAMILGLRSYVRRFSHMINLKIIKNFFMYCIFY